MLVPGAAVAAWFGLGAAAAARPLWTVTAAVLGLVLTGRCVDAVPYGHTKLEDELDRVRLAFYDELSEKRDGSVRCDPECPGVERILRAPNTSERATSATVVAALRTAGLIDGAATGVAPARLNLRQTRDRFVVEAQTITIPDPEPGESPYRVRLFLRATR